jgi:hypothetical protein
VRAKRSREGRPRFQLRRRRAGAAGEFLHLGSRFGSRAPASGEVAKALAEQSGEIVVPHSASAANAQGLTSQVPIREEAARG